LTSPKRILSLGDEDAHDRGYTSPQSLVLAQREGTEGLQSNDGFALCPCPGTPSTGGSESRGGEGGAFKKSPLPQSPKRPVSATEGLAAEERSPPPAPPLDDDNNNREAEQRLPVTKGEEEAHLAPPPPPLLEEDEHGLVLEYDDYGEVEGRNFAPPPPPPLEDDEHGEVEGHGASAAEEYYIGDASLEEYHIGDNPGQSEPINVDNYNPEFDAAGDAYIAASTVVSL